VGLECSSVQLTEAPRFVHLLGQLEGRSEWPRPTGAQVARKQLAQMDSSRWAVFAQLICLLVSAHLGCHATRCSKSDPELHLDAQQAAPMQRRPINTQSQCQWAARARPWRMSLARQTQARPLLYTLAVWPHSSHKTLWKKREKSDKIGTGSGARSMRPRLPNGLSFS